MNFEDMYKEIEAMSNLLFQKEQLEAVIAEMEGKILIEVSNNPQFFVAGKPLAPTAITKSYCITGIPGIAPQEKRLQLAEVNRGLSYSKNKLDILKLEFEKWRTMEVNKRGTTL
jgi:hypothetical protein